MSEFDMYSVLRDQSASAKEVYLAGKKNGLSEIDSIRMLRAVFGLGLREVKEVMITAAGIASTLAEHEAAIYDEVRKIDKD